MKPFWVVLLCLFSVSLQAAPNTIVLFRHAEKAKGGDPSLTPLGKQRADKLVTLLPATTKKLTIFSSRYNRTLETAENMGTTFNTHILTYDAANLPAFKKKLLGLTGVVVVVGHSNTTPELAALLSNKNISAMPETQFDRYFVLKRNNDGYQVFDRLMGF